MKRGRSRSPSRERRRRSDRDYGRDYGRSAFPPWMGFPPFLEGGSFPFPPFPFFPGRAPSPQRSRRPARGGDRDREDRGRPRRAPVRRSPSPGAGKDDDSMLRVAGTSLPQTVAGAIAKRMRKGQRSTLDAAGAQAIHQALKSLAIARTYLEGDNLDICARVDNEHPNRDTGEDNALQSVMRFSVYPHDRHSYRIKSEHPMKVAAHTEPRSTAGAIARDIRDNKTCSVSGLGADSIYQLCKALALAREFLAEDRMDFRCQPFYVDPDSNVLEVFIERCSD